MRVAALERRSPREVVFLLLALTSSLLGHAALGAGVSRIEPRGSKAPVWVEMAMHIEEPPAPEPEPEKPPEPEPPKPPEPKKPEVVKFEETVQEPPPETPPEAPPPKQPRRLQHGLTSDSFAENSGTNIQARQGNTTMTRATDDLGTPEDATGEITVPYTSVSTAPRIKAPPILEVPDEVKQAGIEGRVDVELTVDAEGRVQGGAVIRGLHPAADAACLADLRKTRWKPGTRDGTPVIVQGVPFTCTYRAIDG